MDEVLSLIRELNLNLAPIRATLELECQHRVAREIRDRRRRKQLIDAEEERELLAGELKAIDEDELADRFVVTVLSNAIGRFHSQLEDAVASQLLERIGKNADLRRFITGMVGRRDRTWLPRVFREYANPIELTVPVFLQICFLSSIRPGDVLNNCLPDLADQNDRILLSLMHQINEYSVPADQEEPLTLNSLRADDYSARWEWILKLADHCLTRFEELQIKAGIRL